ncbi:MAG: formylglycine-generating enzyme family protein [Kiritimatiellae bacterium]|nr:formylglycine-generating enzyme family protein [Kiritimatiellia bacterium]
MKRKSLFLFLATVSAVLLSVRAEITQVGAPSVSSEGLVSVTYSLSADAIVTCKMFLDGVAVADELAASVYGDVNRRVAAGSGRTVKWNASAAGVSGGKISVALTAWPLDNPPDYMAVDLTVANSRRYYASVLSVPFGVTSEVYKTDILLMRKIPASGVVWRMGQPASGETCADDNATAGVRDNETGHMVRLTNDFYAAVYETTQLQYMKVTGQWPTSFSALSDNKYLWPVENVSFNALRGAVGDGYAGWPAAGHAVQPGSFMRIIRDLTGIESLDLPTEAEWEYACRAGTATSLNSGKNISSPTSADARLAEVGWSKYNEPKAEHPMPVGMLDSNAWGLYDCHGNVCEFCLDWYSQGDAYRATFAGDWEDGAVTVAPVGISEPDAAMPYRVTRGGGWFYPSSYARSASRRTCGGVTAGSRHDGFRLFCRIDYETDE